MWWRSRNQEEREAKENNARSSVKDKPQEGECMRKKLKPNQNLDAVQSDLIETVCNLYSSEKSVRIVAKSMELSPMKVRKILITAGAYSTDLSTEIGELWKDGKTVGEIAEMLNMTPANVNSYLPYERIIYKMDEKSVNADRQQRYRDRLRSRATSDSVFNTDQASVAGESGVDEIDAGVDKIDAGVSVESEKMRVRERMRTKTMIVVIGRKLRKLIPAEILDDTTDPLARDHSYTWGSNVGGEFVLHEPADPDRMIWCAELTSSGRGAKRKSGIVLMSANCGFAVISPLLPAPTLTSEDELERMEYVERCKAEEENKRLLKEYRSQLETVLINAIRSGMEEFCLPEDEVLDYTDTVRRVELVKGRASFPQTRLEELIERDLNWAAGADPMTAFNVRGNWTSRKFGNNTGYRSVDMAVINMLGLNDEEQHEWLQRFTAPMREKMSSGAQGG